MDGKKLWEVTKGWWLELDGMRRGFLGAVGITAVVLIFLPVLALFDWPPVPWTAFEVGLYNLLIDIAVGVFTIWGLFLAVSEFAKAQVKPQLHLDIVGLDGTQVLMGSGSVVRGKLFLTNAQPKAARLVRIVLNVLSDPPPCLFVGQYKRDEFVGEDFFSQFKFVRSHQFGEDFVVYKGERVYSGRIALEWPPGIRPKEVVFLAELYSLESEPVTRAISPSIHWREETG